MKKQKILALSLIGASLLAGTNSYAATPNTWNYENNKWHYVGENGQNARNTWVKSGDAWYFLKEDGTMASNGWSYVNYAKKWAYFDESGKALSNTWIKSSGKWYYLNRDCYMAENSWVKSGDAWYYLKANGSMAENEFIQVSGGQFSYFEKSGKAVSNKWIKFGNFWRYFNGSCYMVKNETVGGYYIDSNGQWFETGHTNTTVKPVDTTKPIDTVKPIPNKPVEPIKPVNPTPKPKDPEKPVKPVEPVKPKPPVDNNTSTVTPDFNDFRKGVQREFLKLYNEYRSTKGLKPLDYHPFALSWAKARVDYMAQTKHYAHSQKDGKQWTAIFDALPEVVEYNENSYKPNRLKIPKAAASAENIHKVPVYYWNKEILNKDYKKIAKLILDDWIKSPGHNASLLKNPDKNGYCGFDIAFENNRLGRQTENNIYAQFGVIGVVPYEK